jgi:hypothetical protein
VFWGQSAGEIGLVTYIYSLSASTTGKVWVVVFFLNIQWLKVQSKPSSNRAQCKVSEVTTSCGPL